MKFTQHIVVNALSADALTELMEAWQRDHASEAQGYLGARLLQFRDKPGKFVLQVDFDSWEAAQRNNDRPETQRWAARFAEVIDGDPKYENLDVLAES